MLSDITDAEDRTLRQLALGVVLVSATLSRVLQLGQESLWGDEAWTYFRVSDLPLSAVVVEIPLGDLHPPLYFALLDVYTRFVPAEEALLRLPSAVFGLLTVYVVFRLGCDFLSVRTGVFAALLTTFSHLHIVQAQTVRMYTLLSLLTATTVYTYLQMLQRGGRRRDVTAFVLSSVLLGYTHLYGLFVLGALGVHSVWQGLSTDDRHVSLARSLRVNIAIGAGIAPWVGLILYKVARGAQDASWIRVPTTDYFVYTPLHWFDIWQWNSPVWNVGLLGGFLSVCAVGLVHAATIFEDNNLRHLTVFGVVAALSTALPYLLSVTVQPIYVHRYTIGGSLAAFLLFARGLDVLTGYVRGSHVVVAVLLLGLVGPSAGAVYTGYENPQFEEATDYVEAVSDEDDLVVFLHTSGFPMRYYWDGEAETTYVAPDEVDSVNTTGHEDVVVMFTHYSWYDSRSVVQPLSSRVDVDDPVRWNSISVYKSRWNQSTKA